MELCRWTVDLSVLPNFQQQASVPRSGGFYCGASLMSCILSFISVSCSAPADSVCDRCPEFELGLEVDSAEVRGVLMHEGQDWGHAVVDIRN